MRIHRILILFLLLLLPSRLYIGALFGLVHLPGVLHHNLEVLVILYGGAYIGIVVQEMIKCYFTTTDPAVSAIGSKCLQEFC